ncbi:type I-E CRISPR-associated protein Cse2/CasB [Profundibacter sp.]
MSETGETVGSICARWWGESLANDRGPSRKTRAELRRADGPVAALALAAVHELNARLRAAGFAPAPERLALIAAALAHVDQEQGGARAAQAFGAGDPPALSTIRFNALIRAENVSDLWRPLVRALKMVKGKVNAARLAEDIFYWNDKTRTKWCFDYYGKPLAAPTPEETTT